MTRALIMGPSEWDPQRGPSSFGSTPMEIRRALADVLRSGGVATILMEDVDDAGDEDILEKFRRLATRSAISALVVVWPPGAKMQTTFDELLLLREWRAAVPPVWLLHHEDVADLGPTRIRLMEPGGRSRYLEALAGLQLRPRRWRSLDELFNAAAAVIPELG